MRHGGNSLKKWLLGGENILTSVALFDLGQYQGEIIADLFGEEQFFGNVDGFWALQDAAINAKRDDYLAHGWTRVEVHAPWHHASMNGSIRRHPRRRVGRSGWLSPNAVKSKPMKAMSPAMKPASGRSRNVVKTEPAKAAKPELTAPMQNYVELHRLAAIQLELLNHPQVALRLTLAHMIVGSNLWTDQTRADEAREA